MSSLHNSVELELLISGYIRENERELSLSMNVPEGINKMMLELYPLLLYLFGDYKKDVYEVNDDRTIIKGIGESCSGFLIYADLGQFNDIGLNKGIHLWSIKFLSRYSSCFASLGITTDKTDKLINEWCHTGGNWSGHWGPMKGHNYHFQGCGMWNKDKVVTMKLDCNAWTVTWFLDKTEITKEAIATNQHYYFVLFTCDKLKYAYFQVVDTPETV